MAQPALMVVAHLPEVLKEAVIGLVRSDDRDLSARQLGTLLICYLDPEAQTVRGLAAQMKVAKPAITRAVDRLVMLNLVKRTADPTDRRSVLITATREGRAYVGMTQRLLERAARTMAKTA